MVRLAGLGSWPRLKDFNLQLYRQAIAHELIEARAPEVFGDLGAGNHRSVGSREVQVAIAVPDFAGRNMGHI